MTDQELVAKTVFGEITLGDVFLKFNDIRAMCVENDQGANKTYESWEVEEGSLQLYGEYEMDFSFDLDIKVKVRESHLEFENDGVNFTVEFLRRVRFDSLLPGRK